MDTSKKEFLLISLRTCSFLTPNSTKETPISGVNVLSAPAPAKETGSSCLTCTTLSLFFLLHTESYWYEDLFEISVSVAASPAKQTFKVENLKRKTYWKSLLGHPRKK